MKKHYIYTAFACIAALCCLTACHKSVKPTPEAPAKVEVMTAQESSLSRSRAYSGTIEESSGTDLSFELAGTIRTFNISQGDYVRQGQVIATLDNTSLQHAYDIAKNGLDEAQDVYDRMKKLHDANSLPDMEWVEAQNALKSAQSTEAIAHKTLNDAVLRAPFSGYISEKNVDAGAVAAPAIPVARLVVINPIKVNISVAEDEMSKVNIGQEAQMTIASMPGTTFIGNVTERGVTANALSRTYNVKITINNPEGKLLPGMLCDVHLLQQGSDTGETSAIVLPYNSVLLDAQNNNFVWIADNGTATKRIVRIGEMLDDGLAISEGINVGDSVIVAGQQKVSQGGKIEIINLK